MLMMVQLLELTLRENLDLEGIRSDAEIWEALEAANARPASQLATVAIVELHTSVDLCSTRFPTSSIR